MTENPGGSLVSHTTLRGAEGGSDAVRRQVIQIAAGFAQTPSLRPWGLAAGKASRILRGQGQAGRHRRTGRRTAENLAGHR